MIGMGLVLLGCAALFALVSIPCSQLHLSEWARVMLNPTSREFWFPPCPFCWVSRAMAIGGLGAFIAAAFGA